MNYRVVPMGLALATLAASASASFITTNPNLPSDGVYIGASPVNPKYGGYSLQLVLSCIKQIPNASFTTQQEGANQVGQFDSQVFGHVNVFQNGEYFSRSVVSGFGSFTTLAFDKQENAIGTFATEMVSLSMSSDTVFGPLMIRESPTLRSLGSTTITDIGDGFYEIDSYFDIYSELSIDGGQTWIPDANAPSRLELIPAPGAAALLGVVGLLARRRRGD
ncbi:MAG: hypothetical protein K8R92_06450 [Planctomycetes bacterium]|nr:hypothetical protein [Planctomycetota bacterium]